LDQDSEPSSNSVQIHSSTEISVCENLASFANDSDIPIAIRKGVRSCTNHPINRFVSYEGLSPSYHAFVSALDNVQVPKSIEEALKDSGWRRGSQRRNQCIEQE
jgi:hypothetical protein